MHSEAPIAEYKTAMGSDAYDYYVSQDCDTVSVTTAKIRENAKWQNGEDFTAKDVWAYYYIMHPTSSNYMAAVNIKDSKTVEFVWNPLKEPNNTVKELLLAQDKSGTVKYDEFASYVDTVYDIVMKSRIFFYFVIMDAFPELYHVIIDAPAHLFCRGKGNNF